ncbi:enoyl-CoA hydratase [Seongchinamella sediminis]|uniref:Enoyl-CoA hydratase n=1 Tax=Seongchinamella sediminis TaxID=2283635 RepID=A0A3L7E020_9GAMM|nr:MaoC/PaaZ C-terminal domain-containing protein [Seongchinamella sediminis]RLQ21462.1 enoyl-CoA hydratase [Seongchinamella sediminis]
MSQQSDEQAQTSMKLENLAGYELGTNELVYTDRDAILYAIAVGARTDQLDLIYERDLRVLPTYACALGLWAVEAAGDLGAYDRTRSLHASQRLEIHKAMPANGTIQSTGRVVNVWDKGKAAVVEIEVSSEFFTATYAIFLPGMGGWGGERGPSAAAAAEAPEYDWHSEVATGEDQATLYRLTGDRHPVHIDIEVARANGFERPILHGLCTLGIAAREIAAAVGAHPATLRELEAKLAAPVMPGDRIEIYAGEMPSRQLRFVAKVGDTVVLKDGRAVFGQ